MECIVTLPGQLFIQRQSLYVFGLLVIIKIKLVKERRNEILFIDAREIGHMVSRTLKEFSDEDIQKVAQTYHAGEVQNDTPYEDDVAGFVKQLI